MHSDSSLLNAEFEASTPQVRSPDLTRHHFGLLCLSVLAFLSEAVEIQILVFLTTCAGNEYGVSADKRSLLASCVFLGQLVGALFFGYVADTFGRRPSFLCASFIIGLFGFMTALSTGYYSLLVYRFLVGFGVGSATVPYDALSEFLPLRNRNKILGLMGGGSWTLGGLLMAGVAWSSLASLGWRALAIIAATPAVLVFLLSCIYLPESPKWLARNKEQGMSVQDARSTAYRRLRLPIDLILLPSHRGNYFRLLTIWLSFGFSYYGSVMFTGKLYTSFQPDEGLLCDFNYRSIFISMLGQVAGFVICNLVVDRVGRGGTQVILYTLSAVALFVLGSIQRPPALLLNILTLIIILGVFGGSNATWIQTPDAFPTEIRALGHASLFAVGRIGSILSSVLVLSNDATSNFTIALILGLVNIVAAFAAFFLPNKKSIDDSSEDALLGDDHTLSFE